jgi:hypothetical protein
VTVGDHPAGTFPLAVRLPGLGPGRRVVSGQTAAWTGTEAVGVRKRVDWQAPRLRTLSVPRGPMAPLSPDGQGHRGLEADRRRHAEAMKQQGGLVGVA